MQANAITESTFNYMNPFVIGTYYRVTDINYIILFAGIIIVFYMMCVTVLGLIRRIFTIAMLYAVSPPIVAMMPLDNGSAFGKWKGQMIGQVLGAYGAVVGMNLVLIFVSASQALNFSITLFGVANYNSVVVTQIMRLFFIIVALSMAVKLPGMLAGFIGATDAYGGGKEIAGDVVKTAAKGAMVATGVGGLAFKGAASTMRFAGKAASKVGGAVANSKLGQGVKNAAGKVGNAKIPGSGGLTVSSGVKLAKDEIKEKFQKTGGFIKKVGGGAKKVGGAIKNSGIGDIFSATFGESFMNSAGGKALSETIKGDGKNKPGILDAFKNSANIGAGSRKGAVNDFSNAQILAIQEAKENEKKQPMAAAGISVLRNLHLRKISPFFLFADEYRTKDVRHHAV